MGELLGKIVPQFEKENFQRKAWVALAKEDVPIEVFDANFSAVKEETHRVLVVNTTYRAAWTAEIGNDRQESYTDFETYYENIPYTEYETKYNSTTKQNERIPVTKYRKEERQRQVTKYRTITDWHTGNGEYADSGQFFDGIDTNKDFDKYRFFEDYKPEYVLELSDEELAEHPEMVITDSMLNLACDVQKRDMETLTRASVRGDHIRGFSCHATEFNTSFSSLIMVPEYSADIKYNGKTYTTRAFPIGNMQISSAKISNPKSVASEKQRQEDETKAENRKRTAEIEPKVWKESKALSFLSIALLLASILCSLLVKVLFLVISCFAVAIGVTALAMLNTKKIRNRIESLVKAENDAAMEACNNAVENYEKYHKAELLEALNKKLISLGFSLAEMSEINDI